jgi:hypothetical protein
MLMTMWPKFDHEPTEKVRMTVSSVAMRAPEKRKTAARLREVLLAMAAGLRDDGVGAGAPTYDGKDGVGAGAPPYDGADDVGLEARPTKA